VFIVQRTDCNRFSPAADLDPGFAAAARAAAAAGVTFHALGCAMSQEAIGLTAALPVAL
jgi:sugar fermentation stimulation protein A